MATMSTYSEKRAGSGGKGGKGVAGKHVASNFTAA